MGSIENLQTGNLEALLSVYRKRLFQIKKQLLEYVKSGGDSTKLLKAKKNTEKIISKLEEELNYRLSYLITQTYEKSRKENLEKLKILGINVMATALVQGVLFQIFAPYFESIGKLVQNIRLQTRAFARTDFSDETKVIKRLNTITLKKPFSSDADRVPYRDFIKQVENRLKSRTVFTIPYFDKNGNVVRRVKTSTYVTMLTKTLTADIYRKAAQDTILENFADKGDLVEVVGSNSCKCSVCEKYYGKILSLTGKDPNYPSLAEAKEEGLFHPNCVHSFAVTKKVLSKYKEYV